jgi:hypothetical protein
MRLLWRAQPRFVADGSAPALGHFQSSDGQRARLANDRLIPQSRAAVGTRRSKGTIVQSSRSHGLAPLADFACLLPTIACECPRHVAELLMRLSYFETNRAECEQRSRADAESHAYPKRIAAASQAQFEAAIERVALHEGLLPPS